MDCRACAEGRASEKSRRPTLQTNEYPKFVFHKHNNFSNIKPQHLGFILIKVRISGILEYLLYKERLMAWNKK